MDGFELDDVTKMFKVWHTVLSMLVDRGYHVPNEKLAMPKEEFDRSFVTDSGAGVLEVQHAKLRIVARKQDDPTQAVTVFFCPHAKLSVAELEEYYRQLVSDNIYSAIVVLHDKCSSQCRTRIRDIEAKDRRHIELFNENELVVDITKHYLVPHHIVLTPAQKEEVLKR